MRSFLFYILFLSITLSASANKMAFSSNYNFQLSESYYFQNDLTDFLAKAFKKAYSKNEIISISKGNRRNPALYLKWRYRHRHQRNFRRGASFLTPKYILEKYGRAVLGREDGLFVMCTKEMNILLQKANGKLSYVETELGIPSGSWQNTEIIRIDIRRPRKLNLRLPFGNESGANDFWIPGGKLPNCYLESVINPAHEGQYTEQLIILK